MKIGSVKIKEKSILAPMFLVTDVAFRELCAKHGAGLVYTEMVNSMAISRGNNKSFELAKICEEEKPVSLQIFGQKPDVMADAAKILENKVNPSIIDLNFGCPSHDVISLGAGAALLKRPLQIKKIVSAVSKSVSIPVTAKMRIGLDNKNTKKNIENSCKIAKIIESAGANAIAVHGRTLVQGYSGKANWDAIKAIKESVNIPVIGNGDIFSELDAKKIIDKTNCDFIMIGRAAQGNPFIFERANHYLKTEKIKEISNKQKISAFFDYIKLAEKHEILSIQKAKMQAMWFSKGIFGSSRVRENLRDANSVETILSAMKDLKSKCK